MAVLSIKFRLKLLVKLVYTLSSKGKLSKEFELKGQLKDAGLSSMNNIAEGFSRYHKRDSIRFYDISQSSAAEVKTNLKLFLTRK